MLDGAGGDGAGESIYTKSSSHSTCVLCELASAALSANPSLDVTPLADVFNLLNRDINIKPQRTEVYPM